MVQRSINEAVDEFVDNKDMLKSGKILDQLSQLNEIVHKLKNETRKVAEARSKANKYKYLLKYE